ncbi:hypothetical protein BH23CHL8_BH23CHL8_10420 [soil metagenome]
MVNDRLARFFMAVVATLIIMALIWTSVRAA